MTKSKDNSMSKLSLIITLFASLLLAGCSSTPKKSTPKPVTVTQQQKTVEKVYSSDEYLQMAKTNQDSPTYW